MLGYLTGTDQCIYERIASDWLKGFRTQFHWLILIMLPYEVDSNGTRSRFVLIKLAPHPFQRSVKPCHRLTVSHSNPICANKCSRKGRFIPHSTFLYDFLVLTLPLIVTNWSIYDYICFVSRRVGRGILMFSILSRLVKMNINMDGFNNDILFWRMPQLSSFIFCSDHA